MVSLIFLSETYLQEISLYVRKILEFGLGDIVDVKVNTSIAINNLIFKYKSYFPVISLLYKIIYYKKLNYQKNKYKKS